MNWTRWLYAAVGVGLFVGIASFGWAINAHQEAIGTQQPSSTIKSKAPSPAHRPKIEWLNAPYANALKKEIAPPTSVFAPIPTSLPTSFSVVTATGTVEIINAAKQPLLFEAYWCPHCQRTLVLFNKYWPTFSYHPLFVATGFVPGTTLVQAKKLAAQEVQNLHLSHGPTLFLLNASEQKRVLMGFPQLTFSYRHKTSVLLGEQTISVWQQALRYR